jgi:hypothetical protein
MAAYNFKPRYVPHILSGRKRHTIRDEGKRRHARPGERMQLYTGMRTKACKKIMPDPICTKVETIELHQFTVRIEGHILFADECEALAWADGFENFAEMHAFFAPRMPFKGKLIHWRPATHG